MWHQTRRISFSGVVRMAHTHSFVSFPTVCVCVHGGSVVPCRSLTRRTRRNSKPIPVPAFLSLRCFYDRDVVSCCVVWCQCRVVSMSCRVVSCRAKQRAPREFLLPHACLHRTHLFRNQWRQWIDRSIDCWTDGFGGIHEWSAWHGMAWHDVI